jgi:hypothetical protein
MSRASERRMRGVAVLGTALLVVVVALLPGAAWESDPYVERVRAPYEPLSADGQPARRASMDDVAIRRITPPSTLARNPYDLDIPSDGLVFSNWTMAPVYDPAGGRGISLAGSGLDRYHNPDIWIPPMPRGAGHWVALGPTSAGAGPVKGAPGGGSPGNRQRARPYQPPQFVFIPEPGALWVIGAGLLAIVRPGRRPRGASISPACPST